MKVLLLHPDDPFPQTAPKSWDLVVDLARAPGATCERWRRQAGCEVLGLYEFAEEIGDLDRVRRLLLLGAASVVDSWGIDWWEILSLEIAPQLKKLMLIRRLAKELGSSCELYSSRSHLLSVALQRLLGARMTMLESPFRSTIRRVGDRWKSLSQCDRAQFVQMFEDKFDGDHSVRRRFGKRSRSLRPVVLLPAAYANVSRTALAYAEMLPDHEFLLTLTRRCAKPRSLPSNVESASLTPYFAPSDEREISLLLESWFSLKARLVDSSDEFKLADDLGVLARIPSLIRWGISLRDAWNQVFESRNVTACLSADDSNPPSAIPLHLAKKRGLPALACHHGCLDYQMAIKTNHADFYLAKSEMERDYLTRICRLASERIVVAAPEASNALPMQLPVRDSAPWLVFFSEPYSSYGWRNEEVYRDLLPRLCSLARTVGLKLVFKLHPFESVKGYRRMLRRLMPDQAGEIEVIAGPPTMELWSNMRFALTVQSSTAVECTALGIPILLCAWLRDAYSGYVSQFALFGVGHVLESPEQIAEIPRLLEEQRWYFPTDASWRPAEPELLARLFSGSDALPVASCA